MRSGSLFGGLAGTITIYAIVSQASELRYDATFFSCSLFPTHANYGEKEATVIGVIGIAGGVMDSILHREGSS